MLFNGAMVRAILDGRKTQTRRVIKSIPWRPDANPEFSHAAAFSNSGEFRIAGSEEMTTGFRCPHGEIGDRLWVRETWADANSWDGPCVLYRADGDRRHLVDDCSPVDYDRYPGASFAQWAADVESGTEGRWRPSIHMPRWACRLVLEITNVRAERLKMIGHNDSINEGVRRIEVAPGYDPKYSVQAITWTDIVEGHADAYNDPRHAFKDIWTSTGGDWDANPWVWVIEFKRVTGTEGRSDG